MAEIRLPIIGKYANVKKAIEDRLINYQSYIYITDLNVFSYVDKLGELHLMDGGNIEVVDTLPLISEGKKTHLYNVNGTIYSFDGEKYVPQIVDISSIESDIANIKTTLDGLQDESGEPINVVTYVEAAKEDSISYTDEKVSIVNNEIREISKTITMILDDDEE